MYWGVIMESDFTDQLKKDSHHFSTYPKCNMSVLWDMTSSRLNSTPLGSIGHQAGQPFMVTLSLLAKYLDKRP
jgi:hypothetical protein